MDRPSFDYEATDDRRTLIDGMIYSGNDLSIYDGTFHYVHGDSHHYHHDTHGSGELLKFLPIACTTNGSTGLTTLLRTIAEGALHDSEERYPPPNCHPGTREEVLKLVQAWIQDLDSDARFFWLYGPAGAGKSAIMQAIVELLFGAREGIAACFFFGKGQGKRALGRYLFPTIAYQLAVNIPGLREHIDRAMCNDPSLPSRSLKTQFLSLIVKPMQFLSPQSHYPDVVVIDGLDECSGDRTQQDILHLIGTAMQTHQLPLRFLIASRPEPHIRETFYSPVIHGITKCVAFNDQFNPNQDIRKLLQDGFKDIWNRKSSLIPTAQSSIPGQVLTVLEGGSNHDLYQDILQWSW